MHRSAPGRPPEHRGDGPRVALVHHWLVRRRGGERTLAALARSAPGADLFTLVHDRRACPAPPGTGRVAASWLQGLPGSARWFRKVLPLWPALYRGLDLSGYDLVLSSDAGLAKTVQVPAGTPHLCYCYSPPRWAWDLRDVYLRSAVPAGLHGPARALLVRVRRADWLAARRVDVFVASSRHVAGRIRRTYGREAEVQHPPVDTELFCPGPGRAPGPRPYLVLGEVVPYKRFELALDACHELGRPLVVAGDGPGFEALRRRAGADTIFVRRPDDEQVRDLYRGCRALLFPGEEDFGLVPVEAMACGAPVVALGRGGATESVVDGVTGLLYDGDGVAGLMAGLRRFEAFERSHDPARSRQRALQFSTEQFVRGMRQRIAAALKGGRAENILSR